MNFGPSLFRRTGPRNLITWLVPPQSLAVGVSHTPTFYETGEREDGSYQSFQWGPLSGHLDLELQYTYDPETKLYVKPEDFGGVPLPLFTQPMNAATANGAVPAQGTGPVNVLESQRGFTAASNVDSSGSRLTITFMAQKEDEPDEFEEHQMWADARVTIFALPGRHKDEEPRAAYRSPAFGQLQMQWRMFLEAQTYNPWFSTALGDYFDSSTTYRVSYPAGASWEIEGEDFDLEDFETGYQSIGLERGWGTFNAPGNFLSGAG